MGYWCASSGRTCHHIMGHTTSRFGKLFNPQSPPLSPFLMVTGDLSNNP